MDFREEGGEVVSLIPTPEERELLLDSQINSFYTEPELPVEFAEVVRKILEDLRQTEVDKELTIRTIKDPHRLTVNSVALFATKRRQAIIKGACKDMDKVFKKKSNDTTLTIRPYTPPNDAS